MADNYTFKDAGGNTITHASKDTGGGVHATRHVAVDESNVVLAKAEDAAHSSGDKGVMLLAVRKDTAAALAGTDGDYIPLIVDDVGRLHVTPSVSSTEFSYGFVAGSSTGLSAGYVSDWYCIRAATDTDPSDQPTSAATILKYFDTDDAAFDATPVWVKIPIWDAAEGWATFAVTIRNRLNVSMRLDVYAVPAKGNVSAVGPPIANNIAYHSIVSALDVPDSTSITFGPGGSSMNAVSMWPTGWLAIKMTPASDPSASGYWTLMVGRGR